MAWCSFAVHKPLSENHTQGRITPRAVILHTAVSGASSLYDFFQNNSNLESHFYVNNDGVIEQYMDTQIMADANKNANSFAVSIETEDDTQIKPWNPAQVNALVRLVTWLCDVHGIPKRQIPDAYGSGIGWHVMFGAPGPWTPVSKACPGGPRIDQTRNIIIPRVAGGVVEDDVALADENITIWTDGGWKTFKASELLGNAHNYAKGADAKAGAADAKASAVDAKVNTVIQRLDNLAIAGVDTNALAFKVAELLAPKVGAAVADELNRRLDS